MAARRLIPSGVEAKADGDMSEAQFVPEETTRGDADAWVGGRQRRRRCRGAGHNSRSRPGNEDFQGRRWTSHLGYDRVMAAAFTGCGVWGRLSVSGRRASLPPWASDGSGFTSASTLRVLALPSTATTDNVAADPVFPSSCPAQRSRRRRSPTARLCSVGMLAHSEETGPAQRDRPARRKYNRRTKDEFFLLLPRKPQSHHLARFLVPFMVSDAFTTENILAVVLVATLLRVDRRLLSERPPRSPETRAKISRALSGHVRSELFRQRISERMRGRKLSEAHRLHLRQALTGEKNPLYGRRRTPEERRRIAEGVRRALIARAQTLGLTDHITADGRVKMPRREWTGTKLERNVRLAILRRRLHSELDREVDAHIQLANSRPFTKEEIERLHAMVDERHQRGGSGGDGEPLDAVEGAVSPSSSSSSSSSVSAETSPPSPNASPASDSAHRNGQGANSSPVERTSGNAKVPCATCRGDGVLPCSACVQRFGMRSNRCPQCRGSGIEFCRACDGTGYAMRSVTQRR
ncbi:hypothetical protein CDCA_CDCA11G3167 [Cyanidium caldarium]|uniref:Nuclease associated modular domain-containing protein n=1 Tax=Cyanidium caldarium TaxID=2771 RepID=A0AAV9IXY6_CYACA|nr:hypothetical protein CDCA_CDCA11G3167 [Cyanidium caldarium]